MHLLYALSALLPCLVLAVPPGAELVRTPQLREGHTLHPARHPQDDPADLAHLKAATSAQLHYEDYQAVGTVTIPVAKYPLVSLDKSDLASASCSHDGRTMTVAFQNDDAYTVASTDWASHPAGFAVISYIHGCGKGVDTLERSFHLVSSIQLRRGERQIVCTISPVELTDVAHPDHNIRIRTKRFTEPSAKDAVYGVAPTTHLIGRSKASQEKKTESSFLGSTVDFLYNLTPVPGIIKIVEGATAVAKIFTSEPGSISFDTTTSNEGSSEYTLLPLGDFTGSQSNGGKLSGSVTGVGLLCSPCYAKSPKIGFEVNKEVSVLGPKVTFGDISIAGTIDVKLQLKLEGKLSLAGTIEKPFTIGVPSISIDIPKILFIGPAFLFSIGVEGKGEISGSLTKGFECKFGSLSTKLNPSDADDSETGKDLVMPGCQPVGGTNITGADFTLSAFVTAGLGFKVQLFDSDTLTAEVSLKVKLALELLLAIPGCPEDPQHFKVAVDIGVYIYAEGILGKRTGQYNITDGKFSLYESCQGYEGPHIKTPFGQKVSNAQLKAAAANGRPTAGSTMTDALAGRQSEEDSDSSNADAAAEEGSAAAAPAATDPPEGEAQASGDSAPDGTPLDESQPSNNSSDEGVTTPTEGNSPEPTGPITETGDDSAAGAAGDDPSTSPEGDAQDEERWSRYNKGGIQR